MFHFVGRAVGGFYAPQIQTLNFCVRLKVSVTLLLIVPTCSPFHPLINNITNLCVNALHAQAVHPTTMDPPLQTPFEAVSQAVHVNTQRAFAALLVSTDATAPLLPRPTHVPGQENCVEVDLTHCGDASASVAAAAATKLQDWPGFKAAETCGGNGKLRVTFTADALGPGSGGSGNRLNTAWDRLHAALRDVPGARPLQLEVQKVLSQADWDKAHSHITFSNAHDDKDAKSADWVYDDGDDDGDDDSETDNELPFAFRRGCCFKARVEPRVFRCRPPALKMLSDLAAQIEAELNTDTSGAVVWVHRRGATLWLKASAALTRGEAPPADRGGRSAAHPTLPEALRDPSYQRWVRATRALEEVATALSGFVEPQLKVLYARVAAEVGTAGKCNDAGCNDADAMAEIVNGAPSCSTCKAWTDAALMLGAKRKVTWHNVRLGWISNDESGWEM